MGIHTVAFTVNGLSATAVTDVPAVFDSIFAIQNGHFVLSKDLSIVAGYAGQDNLSDAFVVAPSLTFRSSPLRPISHTANPPNNPPLALFGGNRPLVRSQEELSISAIASATGTKAFVLLWLADQLEPAPLGESFWILVPASGASPTADQWSPLTTLQYVTPIPTGEYAVIGFEHSAPNAIAARLIFSGQDMRPGTLSMINRYDRTHPTFYDASLGVLGRFHSFAPPRVEVLVSGTSATHNCYLRVVRIG